jgi:hypothetical protein
MIKAESNPTYWTVVKKVRPREMAVTFVVNTFATHKQCMNDGAS